MPGKPNPRPPGKALIMRSPDRHPHETQARHLAEPFPPLVLAAERVAATVFQGIHGRRRAGQGETFWQFRPYQSGDAKHQIDWRQSAKTGPLYLRQNEWETREHFWLWPDRSASMNYRSDNIYPQKSDRALLLALALAALIIKSGEEASWLGPGQNPSSGGASFARFCHALHRVPGDHSSQPPPTPLPKYARIVLFSDFLDPLDTTRERLSAFHRQGVRGHLLKISDPGETRWAFKGRILFSDPETHQTKRAGRAETMADDYHRAFQEHTHQLKDMARRFGWTFDSHTTHKTPEQALLNLYQALTVKSGGRRMP